MHPLVLIPLVVTSTATGTPVWVTITAATITAIGGTFAWNVYHRWRHGSRDDALQISQAAIEQAQGAKDLFVQYRVELESAQKQIAQYLDQLIQVNRSLGEANARIARLEIELVKSRGEAAEIRNRLDHALVEREQAAKARDQLITQITEMQKQIAQLEHEKRSTHE